MSVHENQFNTTDALKLIESTIGQVKNRIGENGFIFLLWGWLVIAGNVASFLFIRFQLFEAVGITWGVIGIGGGIASAIYGSKKRKKEGVTTQLDRMIGNIWAAVGIGGGIFYFYLIFFGPQQLIGPLVLSVIGIATFASGRMLKFTPLVIGGISFWLFAIGALAFQNHYQFLICAAAMVPGYLVPGYMLRSLYKKQQHVREA